MPKAATTREQKLERKTVKPVHNGKVSKRTLGSSNMSTMLADMGGDDDVDHCTLCGSAASVVACTQPGCDKKLCLATERGGAVISHACVTGSTIHGDFICPTCSRKMRIPINYEMHSWQSGSLLRTTQRQRIVMYMLFAKELQEEASLHLLASTTMRSCFGSESKELLDRYEILIDRGSENPLSDGKRKRHRKGWLRDTSDPANVLVTIEAHVDFTDGDVMHHGGSRKTLVSDSSSPHALLKRVLTDEDLNAIQRCKGSRVLLLCTCGWVVIHDAPRKELMDLVEQRYFDAIVAFTAPQIVASEVVIHLAQFISAHFYMGIPARTALENAFSGSLVALQTTGVALIERAVGTEPADETIVCESLNKAFRMTRPWGLPKPTCPTGCNAANMHVSHDQINPKKQKQEKRERQQLIPARFSCKECGLHSNKTPAPDVSWTTKDPADSVSSPANDTKGARMVVDN